MVEMPAFWANIIIYKILNTLITLYSTQCSLIILPQECSHQLTTDQQSSSWSVFLESGILIPPQDKIDYHIKTLKHKLTELAAIIGYIDKKLEELVYPSLVLEYSTPPVLSQSSLLASYSIFQHLAISIEVVTIDHHHHHYTNKMWRLITITVDNILKNIYTELVMKGISIPAPLTRNIMPSTMRCLPFSANRDIRDFLVLRHILEDVLSYSARLEEV